MNNMPAFFQLASMSFKCICFNKISTEMSLQGKLPFFNARHTCLIDITSMYIQTQFIYIDLHFTKKEVYTYTWQCLLVLYYCVYICIFQHWRNKNIYHHYHLCGRLTHTGTCVRNLTWHSLWYWHVVWSAPSHFLNKCLFNVNLAYFDIRICVGMLSVCYRFEFGIVGLLSVTIPALC